MFSTKNIELINRNREKAIKKKSLTAEQLDYIYSENLFNIWVPREFGGKECTFKKGVEILQKLAYLDGSLGWTVTLCSGANMFAGFMDPEVAKNLYQNKKICLGGSGQASGKANWNGENYIISGYWKYATGTPHLTHFTLNAFVYENDEPILNENGEHKYLSFFVPKKDVQIVHEWDTFGLEATSSQSFTLKNVTASKYQTFELKANKVKHQSYIYKIPFLTFAEITLLSNYIGMASRFYDLAEIHFEQKLKSQNLSKFLENYKIDIDKSKLWIENMCELIDHQDTGESLLLAISENSRKIVDNFKNHILNIFPLCGVAAAQKENELNIVFRNFFTATQHSLLNAK